MPNCFRLLVEHDDGNQEENRNGASRDAENVIDVDGNDECEFVLRTGVSSACFAARNGVQMLLDEADKIMEEGRVPPTMEHHSRLTQLAMETYNFPRVPEAYRPLQPAITDREHAVPAEAAASTSQASASLLNDIQQAQAQAQWPATTAKRAAPPLAAPPD